jgi:histidinol phosphatase-like enzyme
MMSDMAAAFCGEPSVEAFLTKVRRRIYCAPAETPGCLPKWHQLKLAADIARRHNLKFEISEIVEDATDLIA